MVFGERDALSGSDRDHVVMASEDLIRLDFEEGTPVVVRSETGELAGRIRVGSVKPGTVMLSWPEANILVPRGVVDPECGIPAYRDAVVEVIRKPEPVEAESAPAESAPAEPS
jgi:formylmethanofuran dehydrogenase subunit D